MEQLAVDVVNHHSTAGTSVDASSHRVNDKRKKGRNCRKW